MLAALAAAALLLASSARAGGNSITACDGVTTPTTTCGVASVPAADGVFFTVTTGGGNRDFASVAVSCDNGYATVLNVVVEPKGTGSSQTIYPPAGACTADLEKQMQIGKPRILATIAFSVT